MHGFCIERDNRLVMDTELFALKGASQVTLQFTPIDTSVMKLRIKEPMLSSASQFSLVEHFPVAGYSGGVCSGRFHYGKRP